MVKYNNELYKKISGVKNTGIYKEQKNTGIYKGQQNTGS